MLKRYAQTVVKNLFVCIFLSLVLTFLGWFFLNVVFHATEATFTEMWGKIYVASFLLVMAYDTVVSFLALCVIAYIMQKLKMSFDDVFDAFLVYKLFKKQPVQQWTHEWVQQQLSIKRASLAIAEAVVGQMRNLR